VPVAADAERSLASPRCVADALLALHDAPAVSAALLVVAVPGVVVSACELHAAMQRVAVGVQAATYGGAATASAATPRAAAIYVHTAAAQRLFRGVRRDASVDAVLRAHCSAWPRALGVALRGEAVSALAGAAARPRRVALITGGGSGIGAAAARAIAREWGAADPDGGGVAVVVCGRRAAPLRVVCASLAALGATPLAVVADVACPGDVAALFARIEARFGRLDLLFNNAGVGARAAPMEALSPAEWRRVVDVNLSGVFYCTAKAMALMKAQAPRGGRIINNGSVSAMVPRPLSAPYTATKHAVTGLTKSTALDGRRFGIACGQIDVGNGACIVRSTPLPPRPRWRCASPAGERRLACLLARLAARSPPLRTSFAPLSTRRCASTFTLRDGLSAKSAMTARQEEGALQASGVSEVEACITTDDVARAFMCMANMPLAANVLSLTVMATGMPFVGRG
jgi:NAD(P)-dependent dehydrogenase (short-subunit alcohol dehydrogenase family)